MTRRECFNCTHWVPEKPDDWKDPDWGIYYLRNYLLSRNSMISAAGWKGSCRRDPVPVEVRSVHRCGSWVCNADNVWLNLATSNSFACEVDLRIEVDKLRAELKAERERSLERYRKLKVAKARPKTNGAAVREPQEAPLGSA